MESSQTIALSAHIRVIPSADLKAADLGSAGLLNAEGNQALLTGTKMTRVDSSEANLSGVDGGRSRLSGANTNGRTGCPDQ